MFNGIEQVNAVLNCGGRVIAIEPGGAIMRKLREDSDNVSLTLSGCEMKVIVDDSGFDDVAAIQAGIDDLEAGRVVPFEEVDARLRAKLGLPPRT